MFRAEWARLLREESRSYEQPNGSILDSQHCDAIRRIADALSQNCGSSLIDGRLRFGTSQKAFNLYLKYLWRMGRVATPPHCPVDRVVLHEVDIDGSWTKCDNENEYMGWIGVIKNKAGSSGVAEWEHRIWLKWRFWSVLFR